MAGVLESLEPLAALLFTLPRPSDACEALLAAVMAGNVSVIIGLFGNDALALSALRYAGILAGDQALGSQAREQALRLEGVVATRQSQRDTWECVATIPDYLRASVPVGRVSETLPTLRNLITSARQRVMMACPFLDAGFEHLTPPIRHLIERGGMFTLITRELLRPDSLNAESVRRLRDACAESDRIQVVSWEEEGLGLHMKALVADSQHAYIGSANFTRAGMGAHAELGVRVDGPAVTEIERFLDTLADELRKRRGLQAR